MANLNFHIGLPVLVATQGFRIEYKLSTDSVWTFHSIQTGNDVTITGLTAGLCYDVRITFLSQLSPLIECPAVVTTHCLPEVQPCVEIDGEIVVNGDNFMLVIDITYPSPYSEPCNGYILYYGPVTTPQQPYNYVMYPSLSGLSPINIPIPNNVPYYIGMYSLDCQGIGLICDEQIVEEIEVECESRAILLDSELLFVNGLYYIRLTVTPSVPDSSSYGVSYTQTGTVSTGTPDAGGTLNFTATGSNPEVFYFQVFPNTNVNPTNGQRLVQYYGSLTDRCNYNRKWTASIELE